jgi:hypothetical protein
MQTSGFYPLITSIMCFLYMMELGTDLISRHQSNPARWGKYGERPLALVPLEPHLLSDRNS